MNHALGGKLLHHAPSREFVIFRLFQPPGNSLERFNEAGEVREAVQGFGFAEGHGTLVAACTELNQGGGQDGAFEVKVQLGLGESADERLNLRHSLSLAGGQEAWSPGSPLSSMRSEAGAVQSRLSARAIHRV